MKQIKKAAALLLAVLLCASPALAAEDGAENTAPVAENQELETYRGVSVGGCLRAWDPEGGPVTFELVTEPMKGRVELSADGYFVYTPEEGRRGRDYFGFRALDDEGSASQEGTVIIKLLRQGSKLTYADMAGDGAEYAAVALTEAGVFTAERIGGDALFRPGETVSRGEFLSMCMTAAGCELLRGVQATGFLDDDAIGAWLKPYVATALMRGYIGGSGEDARFRPDEPVDLETACVLLNAVLGVTDVALPASAMDMPASPAAQAAANLEACGVMPARPGAPEDTLTRADAAELLQGAMALLRGR